MKKYFKTLFISFQILLKIGIAVYEALDFNLAQDEECVLSQDLHDLISLMTAEGNEPFTLMAFLTRFLATNDVWSIILMFLFSH